MLTAVLILQVLLLFFILVLSIIGWRKLSEKRVSVSYKHVIYHEEGFFRNKVVASYQVQFLYDGLPIGEPTEKIVYSANRVDKEAVQKALTAALQTLQIAIKASGTPLTVLNKVEDVIKTLSK